VTLPNGQQIHIENFPSLAVREALSNALVHRDYHLSAPIAIEHAPEVFKVSSPGPLVAGVTPHNILTISSRPRNRALAKAARTLGLAEETGRGVDRMYREMIRSGRPLPTIASDFDAVSVVLVGDAPDTNIARFVAGLPEQERDDTDTMIVLFQLCATRTLTALLAAPLLQKTPEEAQAILARLSSDAVGLLERTRQSLQRSAATYRLRGEPLRLLGPAVKYNRRSTTETDRKIIAHVQEYEKITNRTLQNFFDLDVYKARDMIADLVARGLLVRVSAQPRGPGVEWGPGPKFPVKKSRLRKIVPPADSDQGTLL
jgi:ATP-dependent DNA helicase RecG